MSWRNNAGSTGANTIPLGTRRRMGDGPEENGSTPPIDSKRGRSPERKEPEYNPDGTKKRRKRNRWGDAADNKAAGLMNLPTAITAPMTAEQLDAYVTHLRIEEISQKLRINDVVPADGDRSPSPPPMYDNMGRRVNTREYRYRKKLEDERHKLIEKAMKIIPSYHPPSDYRRPTKTQEKVYVPVNDYPEINFIGLLIGPRGNTLKKMETESQAKIAIRGKGSVKEGKGKSDAAHASNQDEDLHCLIMADTEDKVEKAKKLIHQVIETAASIPEGQNELKRNQLRELAALNGTLRDDENQACQNCGEIGHRKYDCPQQRNFTANIICRVCGNAGHMARDCPDRQKGGGYREIGQGGFGRRAIENSADAEYEKFMNELGGGEGGPPRQIEYGNAAGNESGGSLPPWKQQAARPPWEQGRQSNQGSYGNSGRGDYDRGGYQSGQGAGNQWQQNSGAAPPWARGGNANGGGGYGDGGYSNPGYGGQQGYGNQGGYGQGYGAQNYGNQGYGQGGYGNQSYGSAPPWQQQQQQQYGAPPPPPPGDVPPPPPPDDGAPPPPPPPPTS